jgi:ferredoxin
MSVRVILDQAICQGHGQCELIAPLTFRIDESSGLAILLQDVHDETRKAELVAAARACPVGAIKILGE